MLILVAEGDVSQTQFFWFSFQYSCHSIDPCSWVSITSMMQYLFLWQIFKPLISWAESRHLNIDMWSHQNQCGHWHVLFSWALLGISSMITFILCLSLFELLNRKPQTEWLITTKIYFSDDDRFSVWWGSTFWYIDGCLIIATSHKESCKGSQVCFIRALVPLMKALPFMFLWLNHLPKTPPSGTIIMGLRFQHINLGGNMNI